MVDPENGVFKYISYDYYHKSCRWNKNQDIKL